MPGCLGLGTSPCPNPAFQTVRLAKRQRTVSAKKEGNFPTAPKEGQHLNF